VLEPQLRTLLYRISWSRGREWDRGTIASGTYLKIFPKMEYFDGETF
jgi:hypothetical protein